MCFTNSKNDCCGPAPSTAMRRWAEGFKTKEELIKLIELGANYGQGFYLQKSDQNIISIDNEVLFTISEANKKKNHLIDKTSSEIG